jgi:hypothetical protein
VLAEARLTLEELDVVRARQDVGCTEPGHSSSTAATLIESPFARREGRSTFDTISRTTGT